MIFSLHFQFIAGYFQGSICNTPQLHVSCVLRSQSTGIDAKTIVEQEIESQPNGQDQIQSIHVLGLLKRKTIQFSMFCEIEHKWEKTSKLIDLTLPIESFRDAVMIPVDKKMMVFHMQNGVASQAHHIPLDYSPVETIALPNGIEGAGLALFCQLNDKIYCFARTDQQFFHK